MLWVGRRVPVALVGGHAGQEIESECGNVSEERSRNLVDRGAVAV